MKNKEVEFVIIGSGNVAWHLAKKIASNKKNKLSVYNHQNNETLNKIKHKFKCEVFSNLDNVTKTADFYFLCVTDQSIESVAKKIKVLKENALLMHTSGSQKLQVLGKQFRDVAVFYPLQSFSKKDKLSWSDIPIIIEANSESALKRVKTIAKTFSHKVVELKYQERLQLHLAAVLVNNFTNALYVEAYNLLPKTNDANHNLLLPIIKQSVNKLNKLHPLMAQTGPAKRGDILVMDQHLALIGKNTRLKNVYKTMTQLVVLQQKK